MKALAFTQRLTLELPFKITSIVIVKCSCSGGGTINSVNSSTIFWLHVKPWSSHCVSVAVATKPLLDALCGATPELDVKPVISAKASN